MFEQTFKNIDNVLWKEATNRSFMAEQGRDYYFLEQDWLSLGIQVITTNWS